MVGYAVYKKNKPGPIQVLQFDQPLSDQKLDALNDELITEHNYASLTIRLMNPHELDNYLSRKDDDLNP